MTNGLQDDEFRMIIGEAVYTTQDPHINEGAIGYVLEAPTGDPATVRMYCETLDENNNTVYLELSPPCDQYGEWRYRIISPRIQPELYQTLFDYDPPYAGEILIACQQCGAGG